MNKLIFTFIVLVSLNNCSFNENSKIWKDKDDNSNKNKNVTRVLTDEKKVVSEFNQGLKLDFSQIKTSSKVIEDQNNFGSLLELSSIYSSNLLSKNSI